MPAKLNPAESGLTVSDRGEPLSFDTKYDSDPKRNYSRLLERIHTGKPIIGEYPLNVQIQTVSSCNATCEFCPYPGSWHDQNPGSMSWEIYEKIIKGLAPYPVRKFSPYLENEPTLDKEIMEKVEYALKHILPGWTEISTNLSFLNERMLRKIEDIFPNIPHEIWISFHGCNKETYEDIMGLKFDRTLDNVMQLVELAQIVPINFIIRGSGKPRDNMGKTKNWFGEKEYRAFWDRKLKKYKHKPKIAFFTYHDRAGQIQLKEKGMSFDTIFLESLDNFYCVRFDRWIQFLYTGEPILCCMDYNRETVYGESIKDQSFDELFSSPKRLEQIEQACGLKESDPNFICKRCISPGG